MRIRKRKVFCVGLNRTGSTSLGYAMQMLGYSVVFFPYRWSQIKKRDYAGDHFVNINYKKLDKKYPHSKFILTVRDYQSWIKSVKNHFRRFPASKRHVKIQMLRLRSWGTVNFNKRLMTKKYYEYNEEVLDYFKGREKDLLIMNVCAGDGWKKLCPFLGKTTLRRPFPRENVGVYKKRSKRKR